MAASAARGVLLTTQIILSAQFFRPFQGRWLRQQPEGYCSPLRSSLAHNFFAPFRGDGCISSQRGIAHHTDLP